MNPSTPSPAGPTRGISPRKIILALILAASILFFFLVLFAGAIATLREAAPHGHAGLTPFFILVRRIAHHFRIR